MTNPILPDILTMQEKFKWDLNAVQFEKNNASVQVIWKDHIYTIHVHKDNDFKDLKEAQEALKQQIDTAILLMARYASEDVKQLAYDNQNITKTYKAEPKFHHELPAKPHKVDFEYEKQIGKATEKLQSQPEEKAKVQDRLNRINEAIDLQKMLKPGFTPSREPIVVQAAVSPALPQAAAAPSRSLSKEQAELQELLEEATDELPGGAQILRQRLQEQEVEFAKRLAAVQEEARKKESSLQQRIAALETQAQRRPQPAADYPETEANPAVFSFESMRTQDAEAKIQQPIATALDESQNNRRIAELEAQLTAKQSEFAHLQDEHQVLTGRFEAQQNELSRAKDEASKGRAISHASHFQEEQASLQNFELAQHLTRIAGRLPGAQPSSLAEEMETPTVESAVHKLEQWLSTEAKKISQPDPEAQKQYNALLDENEQLKARQRELETLILQQQEKAAKREASADQTQTPQVEAKDLQQMREKMQQMSREKEILLEKLKDHEALLQENLTLVGVNEELQRAKTQISALRRSAELLEQQKEKVKELTEIAEANSKEIAKLKHQETTLRRQLYDNRQELSTVRSSATDENERALLQLKKLEDDQRKFLQERQQALDAAVEMREKIDKNQKDMQQITEYLKDVTTFLESHPTEKDTFSEWYSQKKRSEGFIQ